MPLHRAGHASVLRAPLLCPRVGVSLQARASRYVKKDGSGDTIEEDEVEEEKAADAVPESQELSGAIPPKWWLGQDPKKRWDVPSPHLEHSHFSLETLSATRLQQRHTAASLC